MMMTKLYKTKQKNATRKQMETKLLHDPSSKKEIEIKYDYTMAKDGEQKIDKAFDLLFDSVFETFKSG
jgi:hypothetical protein